MTQLTKKQAVDFAKINGLTVKLIKVGGAVVSYVVGEITLNYCGYGNNYNIGDEKSARSLGRSIEIAVNRQIN